jgi:hypothetical protein
MVGEFGIAILPDLLANDAWSLSALRPDASPLPEDCTTPVRAIGSGARFTKSASHRLNCGRTTTPSCSTIALG